MQNKDDLPIQYDAVIALLEQSKLHEKLSNTQSLEESIKLIDRFITRHSDNSIYFLGKGILYYFNGSFHEAHGYFRQYIEDNRASADVKKFAETMALYCTKYIKLINVFRVYRKELNQSKISLVGCVDDFTSENFYWTNKLYLTIQRTDLGLLDGFARRNIVYLHNSYYYNAFDTLLDHILSEQNYIIFNCHSKTDDNGDPEVTMDFTGGEMDIKFDLFYNQIRAKFGTDLFIILIGCSIKLNGKYKNVIYFEDFMDDELSTPFIKAFCHQLPFSNNTSANYYLAKIYTSLFSNNTNIIKYT